jgi:predicted metal-binding protein
MSPGIVLHLCAPCLSDSAAEAAAGVARAVGAAGLAARVELGPCLGPCGRPVALALQGNGATCVFAGLRLPGDAEDLVATCRAYRDARGGWIEDARPCGRLRFCLHARVPGAPTPPGP